MKYRIPLVLEIETREPEGLIPELADDIVTCLDERVSDRLSEALSEFSPNAHRDTGPSWSVGLVGWERVGDVARVDSAAAEATDAPA